MLRIFVNMRTIPIVYGNNQESKPSNLFDQLQMVSRCGFRDVDCFYKYSIFAVYGGTKTNHDSNYRILRNIFSGSVDTGDRGDLYGIDRTFPGDGEQVLLQL